MHISTMVLLLDLSGSLVAVAGEQIHPHLSYLLGMSDLLGWTGRYVPSWVCEFYSSLWIDPRHRFIHFAF